MTPQKTQNNNGFPILHVLHEASPQALTINNISFILHQKYGKVKQILRELVKAGSVHRMKSLNDYRRSYYKISERGIILTQKYINEREINDMPKIG